MGLLTVWGRLARSAGPPRQRRISTTAELDGLPNLTVVQFRGTALRGHDRLVWQLDEQWFSPGSTESVPSSWFPPEAFPAFVLWSPGDTEHRDAQQGIAGPKPDCLNDSPPRR
ncbi:MULTISPECIES: hypothetical protein [Mycolicibacter]|uniref:Uncharacterized protein n=2 Tax=Mycolicibacter TaxID=1073531 RepID=A0ABU5XLA7_9MYCO|nr:MULTISPECIES: hypothetical protein [unclassified Mycolicibacter]MEB3022974.1 hypothetical protein [Mycolicibacter sp. MYC098]MEB3033484.1 hypothetical protein [Mycolicibacter sp. MYC340]